MSSSNGILQKYDGCFIMQWFEDAHCNQIYIKFRDLNLSWLKDSVASESVKTTEMINQSTQ
jgi:hypothetical protein